MERIRTSYLIHGFAALHVAVTALCALFNIPDSLLLTALTMLLTVLICLRRNLSVELTAIFVILANILGFVLGSLGAQLFKFPSEILSHALATFFTTEILGWALDLFARAFHIPSQQRGSWKENLGWLLFAVAAVFALRLFVELFVFRKGPFLGVDTFETFRSFLGNSLLILLMFVGTIFFIRYFHGKRFSLDIATVGTSLFIGILSVLCALAHTYGLPFHWNAPLDTTAFARNIVVAILVEMTLFGLIYLVEYAVNIRHELATQRERRHLAEYRYMALKNQVNPHFLFNSLNILDSLVQDGDQEGASLYIHKLAGIYRYMLQHDGSKLVRLSEEVTFMKMYGDLLEIRFPEGFSVETDIAPDDLSRMIVPCTLQLLLENVTKHNVISASDPVRVHVRTGAGFLEIENNRMPKASSPVSTGLGLPYIRQQYLDLSGQEILIEKDEGTFRVRIPLL